VIRKPKEDPKLVVQALGIVIAGRLRAAFADVGGLPRTVSLVKKGEQWDLSVRDAFPVFSDNSLTDRIWNLAERSCGVPLTFVQDFPNVGVGCLRCVFGVDVMDLFPRGACA